jgi:putative membrane-bound dehydrogenase-like protein
LLEHLGRLWCTLVIGAVTWSASAASGERLPPEDSLKAIHLAAGYEIELVAAEPLVQSPVAIDWSPDGRLWVVEMLDYPTGMDGKGKPGGRIKVLDDSDGDGRFDKANVVLDGVRMPTGIAHWRDGVLVAAAPDIFFVRPGGEPQVLFTGFKEGNPQLRVNALRWGLDGWIYCANGMRGGTVNSVKTGQTLKIDGRDVRLRPDDGAIEVVSGVSQYGRDRDDYGNWFGLDNSNPLFHFVLEDRYLRRNADAPPIDPKRQLIVPANGPVFAISAAKNQFDRTLASPGHPGHFTSACGVTVYRDELLFGREAGVEHAFVCEPVHNLVRHAVLKRRGISFTVERAGGEEDREFLASEDTWFRPVMLRTGPDGALWVVDMGRFMVEHPEWLPAGGPQKMAPRFRDGAERGRIYRVYPKGRRPGVVPKIEPNDTAGLIAAMRSANGWVRDKAQQLLMWGEQKPGTELPQLARGAESAAVRIQALWTLVGMSSLDAETLAHALHDAEPAVRREGLRIVELRPKAESERWLGAMAEMASDPDAAVRLQLACTLGEWDAPEAGAALARVGLSIVDDAHFTAAVLSSAGMHYTEIVDALLRAGRPPNDPLCEGLLGIALAKKDRATMAKVITPMLQEVHGGYRGEQIVAYCHFSERLRERGLTIAKLREAGPEDALGRALAAEAVQLMQSVTRSVAFEEEGPLNERLAAIGMLGDAPFDQFILGRLLGPQNPPEVQAAAVRSLLRGGDARAPETLMKDWASHSPQLRGVILEALVSREPWAYELLKQAEAGKVPLAQFDPARRQRLLKHSSARVKELAEKLFGSGGQPGEREKVVEQHRPALALAGDAARGAKVFAQNCATCHRLGDVGQEIGPDLRSVSGWEKGALLVAILDPNRQVEPRYLSYTVVTNEGQSGFGIITAETAGAITIKGLDGKEQVLQRANVKSLEGTNQSLMPVGVESAVSDQDLADVIRFLQSGGAVSNEK